MGTEEFWVPLALAAVSGGAQYANASAANSRQDKSEAQAIADQQAIRQKGEQAVNKTVAKIGSDDPGAIAAKEQGNFVAQLRRNAAGSSSPSDSSSLAPAAGASSRYNTQKGTAQQNVQAYGDKNASELGDLDAAIRQRQNEGLEQQTLGTNLNTLGAQSYSTNFVDQLRAQQAGQTNPWVSLFSTMVGNVGQAASKNPQWFQTAKNTGVSSLAPQTINAGSMVAGGGNPWNA